MILGGNTVMSTTVDGSATLNPPSMTKSSPCNEFKNTAQELIRKRLTHDNRIQNSEVIETKNKG